MKLISRWLLSLLLLAGLGFANPAHSTPGLAVPAGPMLLTRTIERELPDGEKVIVTRSWSVRFEPQGRGYAISGNQVSVKVSAPQKLAELARIEEQRDASDIFPFLLAADGRIIGAGADSDPDVVKKAVEAAEGVIARSRWSADEKREAAHYLTALQAAGGSLLDTMPPDLFFPTGSPLHHTRSIALPDGSSGEIELLYTATIAPSARWLERAERRIVTRLGSSSQISREIWTLTPQ